MLGLCARAAHANVKTPSRHADNRRQAAIFQGGFKLRLLRGQHRVIAFAFAQQQVFAEEEVVGGDGALKI